MIWRSECARMSRAHVFCGAWLHDIHYTVQTADAMVNYCNVISVVTCVRCISNRMQGIVTRVSMSSVSYWGLKSLSYLTPVQVHHLHLSSNGHFQWLKHMAVNHAVSSRNLPI